MTLGDNDLAAPLIRPNYDSANIVAAPAIDNQDKNSPLSRSYIIGVATVLRRPATGR